ncbi:MAG: tetratricopeptide repeat protein [Verrucomicrobiales bacterium]
MITRSSKEDSGGGGQVVWWAVAAVVAALVMVLKPAGTLTVGQWKWAVGILGLVMLWRLWGLLRSSSCSLGRIVLWLLALALAGSLMTVGVPGHWFRVPGWSEVSAVVLPLAVGVVALGAVLVGLAGLNRRREIKGTPQRSYLPILLNLIIVAAAWHIVRQPLWKQSLEGMMRLPQVHSNRIALEQTIGPLGGGIGNEGESAPNPEAGSPAHQSDGTAPTAKHGDGTSQADADDLLKSGAGTGYPLGKVPLPAMPANAEQWIWAAVHNKDDPMLELRACQALVAEGRPDQALSRLAAARNRRCQSPELIRFHADLLFDKTRPAAAAAVLESLATSPAGTSGDVQKCLVAWQTAGQDNQARILAERLLVLKPSRDLFRWLADHYAAAGNSDRALALLGQLSRRSPFNPDDAHRMAEVALQSKRPDIALDAVDILTQAGHRSPRVDQLAARARASSSTDPRRRGTAAALRTGG